MLAEGGVGDFPCTGKKSRISTVLPARRRKGKGKDARDFMSGEGGLTIVMKGDRAQQNKLLHRPASTK